MPGKVQLEQVKGMLQQVWIFNATLSFNHFEIQKYYQNELKINDDYSRNNLPKIKDGTYVIYLNERKSVGTFCIVLYINNNNVTYFDSFGPEHI